MYKRQVPGVRKFVSVDGGMGDNIRPALYQAEYEVIAATKINQNPVEKVTIAGKYCESGDLLASDIMLPELESGDLLAIPAAGAYCPSMASNYNMNPRPPMVVVKDGKSRMIRRREATNILCIATLYKGSSSNLQNPIPSIRVFYVDRVWPRPSTQKD